MTSKRVRTERNSKTGSYTVRVPKSASTGTFVSRGATSGRIQLGKSAKKTA